MDKTSDKKKDDKGKDSERKDISGNKPKDVGKSKGNCNDKKYDPRLKSNVPVKVTGKEANEEPFHPGHPEDKNPVRDGGLITKDSPTQLAGSSEFVDPDRIAPFPLDEKKTLLCTNCGNEIDMDKPISHTGGHNFCSKVCANAYDPEQA